MGGEEGGMEGWREKERAWGEGKEGEQASKRFVWSSSLLFM